MSKKLTPMEGKVMDGLAHGNTAKEEAVLINISISMVKKHSGHAREKLKARNTTNAVFLRKKNS